ncbi:MAG: SCO1664 family protein [Acidimicrobiales bacterium]
MRVPPRPVRTRVPEDQRLPPTQALEVLALGQVEVQGRMPWSSNGTFLVTCGWEDVLLPAVYKPVRGERPLWDFPDGLSRREAAAYQLSVALDWDLVPETLIRHDAPLGAGSLQRFVPADFSQHYFTLLEEEAHHDALRAICAFDVLANNADRKGGHCLLTGDSHVWAIDNGLCFHPEPKLRTVVWDFAGEALPERLLAGLGLVAAGLPRGLAALLAPEEAQALVRRAAALLARPRFPAPHPERRPYPWPLV